MTDIKGAELMRLIPVLCITLLAAACGGAKSGGSDAGSGPSIQSLYDKLSCTNQQTDAAADQTAFTAASGSCDYKGDTVYVSTFTTNEARDNFLKVAKASGGRYDVGDRFIVYGNNPSTADALKSDLGGDVRTS